MTGRYPSRSAFGRKENWGDRVANVRIPSTKLVDEDDVPDGDDCSKNNIAAIMKKNGYRTGMTGKWHLTEIDDNYRYRDLQETIQGCGFDFAESIYAENQNREWHNGDFSHNLEFMAAKGVEFIEDDPSTPFFMYFNPTVPHDSADVHDALTDFDCRDTPEGRLSREPVVKGMTRGSDCESYRETVLRRADGRNDNNHLGSIWLDDAIGALLQALDDTDQLDNTFFLFQMDHGQEGKTTIWESGGRIAQFVHFPDKIPPMQFHGMVSTVDLVKTILDYAGIDEDSPGYYETDGKSWRPAVESEMVASTWNDDRCIFIEMDRDRAVRCGCYKYMELQRGSNTFVWGNQVYDLDGDTEVLFDLCDNNGRYEDTDNKEEDDIKNSERDIREDMEDFLECHLERTRADERQDFSPCGFTPITRPDPTRAPTSPPTPPPTRDPTTAPVPGPISTRAPTSGSVEPQVTGLSLIDADSNAFLRALTDGDVIFLDTDGTELSIRAETSGSIGSVRFSLDGDTNHKTESAAPYALNGDSRGDHRAEPALAELGRHTIVATPFSGSGGSGSSGISFSATVIVVSTSSPNPPVDPPTTPVAAPVKEGPYLSRFVLVDASSNEDIHDINDGDVLYLDGLPSELNIRAETVPARVGSVQFFLNGDLVRTENSAPYAMYADDNGDYDSHDEDDFSNGNKELTAIPYSGRRGSGEAYTGLTVRFKIEDFAV